jgi:hypothetical protein
MKEVRMLTDKLSLFEKEKADLIQKMHDFSQKAEEKELRRSEEASRRREET